MKVFLWLIVFAFFIELPTDVLAQTPNDTISSTHLQSGEIYGKVIDEKGQPMDFATVQVFDKDVYVSGAKTDIYGNYKIKPFSPGVYTVKVKYVGYNTGIIENVNFENESKVILDFKLTKKQPIKGNKGLHHGCTRRMFDPSEPNKKVMTKSDLRNVTR